MAMTKEEFLEVLVHATDDKAYPTGCLSGTSKQLSLGGPAHNGFINGHITLHGPRRPGLEMAGERGYLVLRDGESTSKQCVELYPSHFNIWNGQGQRTLHYNHFREGLLFGETGDPMDTKRYTLMIEGGSDPSITVGGAGTRGIITLKAKDFRNSLALDGESASLTAGCEEHAGQVTVTDAAGNATIELDGANQRIVVGGHNGSSLTTEGLVLKVDHTSVPDFVFEDDYPLRSLADIKTFVAEHHHLPDLPSATEMAQDGLDVGDMCMRLLQKVEELTLHAIEQSLEIEKLKTSLEEAQARRQQEE